MKVTVAHESVPKLGELANGDAAIARRDDGGRLLLAVIDGLGHGPNAAQASAAAIAFLQAVPLDRPLAVVMQDLHNAMRGTRGAAATACMVSGRALEVCAVGNVQLTSVSADIPLVLSSGVLGVRVSKYRICAAELAPGARIALYSDGISSRFRLDDSRRLTPSQACRAVLEHYRKREDDATILIADMEA